MKLLITGSCGHIGSYLSANINKISKIKKTYLLDNLNSGYINSLFESKKNNNLEFISKDLSLTKSLDKLKKIDYVIHLASITDAANSFKKKKIMYKNNLNCMKNVIKFCIKKKAKLIHISSSSVYGKNTDLVDETCEKKFLKPQSPYADIKLIEENMLKKNKKKLKYISFRFGTISGVSKGMRFHTAVNKFCLNAALNKPITVYKTAYNQLRPYLSLKDAFNVFKFTINKDVFNNETFNAVSENFTVKDIINIIKKYKKNIKIKYVSNRIMNKLSYRVSGRKLEKLGLHLNNRIEKDIKETLFILKNI